jgi:hypothetical protein
VCDTIEARLLRDPSETLIRRGYWKDKRARTFVRDQVTGRWRPPAAAFQPRKDRESYLSVNIESSMAAAGQPPDWGVDHARFFAVRLTVGACSGCGLSTAREPVDGNPHHAGIYGVVELQKSDDDAYQNVITDLAKASEILAESLAAFDAPA